MMNHEAKIDQECVAKWLPWWTRQLRRYMCLPIVSSGSEENEIFETATRSYIANYEWKKFGNMNMKPTNAPRGVAISGIAAVAGIAVAEVATAGIAAVMGMAVVASIAVAGVETVGVAA